jgi:diguanylate cyclase (GGDEF)-like protein/PAS domain S-box-containing protein
MDQVYSGAVVGADSEFIAEGRFRALFNSTYQFMGLQSVDGILLEANEPALAIGGVTRAEVIGQPLWETPWFSLSEQARTDVRQAIEQAAHGQFVRYELEIPTSSGQTLMVDFSLNPVFDEARRVIHIIPEARDISVKYQLAQQLVASERRLLLITDNIPAMIGYIDENQRYGFVNQATEDRFGIPKQQIVGQTVEELLGPASYARAQPYLIQALSGQTVTFNNHHGNGTHTAVTYVPDRQNDVIVGIYFFVSDITAQTLAAQELFGAKERARTTLESIGDGVATINAAGMIDYLNPIAEHLTGWSLASAVGKHVDDVFHLTDQETGQPINNPLYAALLSGSSVAIPARTLLRSADGSEYFVEDSCTPIHNVQGVVTGAVLVFRDISDKQKSADRLLHQASHDFLTGLLNRAAFEHAVDTVIARGDSTRHVVLFIDLDRFKAVNDICGHKAGDQLLRELVALVAGRLRVLDVFARLGGDEFGILLESCPLPKATQIAQTLINEIAAYRLFWQGNLHCVGASIGMAVVNGSRCDAAAVIAQADSACLWAKEHGRHQVKLYDSVLGMVADHSTGENWIGRINAGLHDNRFCLHAQQIVSAVGHGPPCFEVLLRLAESVDNNRSLVPPMAFLPEAQRYGLMPEIDRWVIRRGFEFAKSNQSLIGDGFLSVNLANATLAQESLVSFVAEHIRGTGLAPRNLCFEISESGLLWQSEQISRRIADLRALGCLVSIDHFAGAPSSFVYLQKHPVDYVKIDASYVQSIGEDRLRYGVVEGIHRLARLIGINTIATGVETAAVKDALNAIGVDYLQGFALHRPQDIASLGSLL